MLELKVSLSAKKVNLEYFDDVIINALNHFNLKEARKIQFALHEAIINSVQACERCVDPSNDMLTVELVISEKVVEAKVKDYFGGFELCDDSVDRVITTEDLLKPNGRGMLLIDHLVDELKLYSEEDGAFVVDVRVAI